MPFDFSLLAVSHLGTFLATFGLCFFWIAWQLPRSPKPLLAGVPIITIGAMASALVVNEPALALGLIIASLLVVFFGGLDEKYRLPVSVQLSAQLLIAVIVVAAGWVIPYVTNPFGPGVLHLSSNPAHLFLYAPLWTIVFLLAIVNAINWLDGLDGLSGGVGLSAFAVLSFISLLPSTQDARTLSLGLIGLGVFGAFCLWNIPPAKAYLGTSGAWFLGLMLALTAIVGGGKIATTLLVLAIPVVDTALVVVARLNAGQKPWVGDKKYHLHYRLLAHGFSSKQAALTLAAASFLLGLLALLLPTWLKIVAIIVAAGILCAAVLHAQRGTIRA